MGLNKSKGNMYEWVTHTWNPLAGKCTHACSYCSTNKFYYPSLIEKYSGEQRLVEKELKTNLGSGNFIFVCAQNDLFNLSVPHDIIQKVLNYCSQFRNDYLFQSKNPFKFINSSLWFPNTSVFCTTIETNRFYEKIMGNTPRSEERAYYLPIDSYITIEPILNFDLKDFITLLKGAKPRQINVGADSGHNNLPEPSKEKILELIFELEKFTVVKVKENLKRLIQNPAGCESRTLTNV
jgi:hypothetical protein